MCGIFGLIGRGSAGPEQSAVRATHAMAHRGPDDKGTQVLPFRTDPGRCVALGACRLAILDLTPAGHQPMHDSERGNWLIFNGEIFNYLEIRAELEKRGHTFSSHADTEVLLKAYGEWGDDCLDRLRGMFAFAIWDTGKERLLLARDRLGEKPLYFFSSADFFVFASELRALLATGLIARRWDLAGVMSYLQFGSVQAPLTMVEGIRLLLPGRKLIWKNGQWSEQVYWNLAEIAARPPAAETLPQAAEAIRKILLEAVSLRLISDVPVGIFLSGGVDSSSIVALASEVSRVPPTAYSVVFAEREYSEARYAESVARTYGVRHQKVEVREELFLANLDASLAAMDQPTMDGVNTYLISQAVKQAGITVALSGLGGDELFAGYSYFRSVPWMVRFRRLAGWTGPFWAPLEGWAGISERNSLRKLATLLRQSYAGDHPYFLCRALFVPQAARKLLSDAEANPRGSGLPGPILDLVRETTSLDVVNQVSVLEGATYMANTLLRDTDVMSMAHSLEVRSPFVDHKLWEFVLSLRRQLKLDSRLPKPLLIRAAGQRLPREVYTRRKMGFTLPFDRWLRGPLKDVIGQELSRRGDEQWWPVDPAAVSEVWEAFLHGKTSWSRPWSLFVLKRWMRRTFALASTD
jgi:asparagine synthase (glutamine-hydrolysing)